MNFRPFPTALDQGGLPEKSSNPQEEVANLLRDIAEYQRQIALFLDRLVWFAEYQSERERTVK